MSKFRDYVFVLWGDQFEEAAATLFVTGLRQAGLRVKVVGLTPPRIRGAHGLALMPDLTLDQALALATQVVCLIIPYAAQGIKRLKNDPRLDRLFRQAIANKAKLVIGSGSMTNLVDGGLAPTGQDNVLVYVYPTDERLLEFVSELAGLLSRPAK